VIINKTKGRTKAIRVQAAACIPPVFEKISIERPIAKESPSSKYNGVSKGNNKMNITYKYGLTILYNPILFKIITCSKMRKKKRNRLLK
jgi:hypothetical protein